MRLIDGAIATTVAALLSAAPFAGQSSPNSAAPCTVTGDVVDESNQPVAGVSVVVFPVDQQQWPAARETKALQWVRTESGRFTLAGLPAGSYRLNVTRDDFGASGPDLTQLSALQQRAFPVQCASGTARQLRAIVNENREITRVMMSATDVARAGRAGDATLPPANPAGQTPAIPPGPTGPGAISGTVTDEAGRPVAGVPVQRFTRLVRDGAPQLARSGPFVTTDEQGAYRLAGLVAGQFFVGAVASSVETATGRLTTVRHMPAPIVGPDGRKTGYVTTFYPGTDDPDRAGAVVVGTTEARGVDVRLVSRPLADVRGTIAGWSGGAFDPHAVLLPTGGGLLAGFGASWCPVAPDGAFAFTDLPIGDYVFAYEGENGWAREPVTLTSPDGTTLTISLRAPLNVHGHVEFLGDTPAPTGPALQALRVRLSRADPVPGSRSVEVAIAPGGDFTVRGIAAGRYTLQTRSTPPWTEMSGTLGGVDTLDQPVEIRESRNDATVVMVDRGAGVSGMVRDDPSTRGDGAVVIVFSAEREHWSPGARRTRTAQVVPGGAFSIAGLPPGRYVAIAIPATLPRPALTPAFFESHADRGQRFELAARERRDLSLTVVRDR